METRSSSCLIALVMMGKWLMLMTNKEVARMVLMSAERRDC